MSRASSLRGGPLLEHGTAQLHFETRRDQGLARRSSNSPPGTIPPGGCAGRRVARRRSSRRCGGSRRGSRPRRARARSRTRAGTTACCAPGRSRSRRRGWRPGKATGELLCVGCVGCTARHTMLHDLRAGNPPDGRVSRGSSPRRLVGSACHDDVVEVAARGVVERAAAGHQPQLRPGRRGIRGRSGTPTWRTPRAP